MDERPTFGSLFAGIGGIDLGLERAGWRCRWQVEWDDWCRTRLADRWPDLIRYGDITDVEFAEVERVDLLAGGFPCQPVSAAGRQKAQADARWLWPEFLRAICALRPRLVLVENVPNLLAVGNGSAFGDVLGDLAASGYDAEWDCIPAAAIGAPHERDRVFLVAYPDDGGREGSRLHEGPGRPEQAPIDADGEGSSDVADAGRISGERRREPRDLRRPAGTAESQASQRQRRGDTAGDRGQAMADSASDRWREGRSGDTPQVTGGRDADRGGIGGPLAHTHGPRLEGRVFHPERGSQWFAGPSGVEDAASIGSRAFGKDGGGSRRANGPRGAGRERITEPRLGGTPDGFSYGLDHCWPAPPGPQYEWEPPRTVSGRVPDRTQRLKACGNAVVPQVVEIIGRWLLEAERLAV